MSESGRTVRRLSDQTKNLICAVVIVGLAWLFMGDSLLPDKAYAPLDILMTLPPWSNTAGRLAHAYNALPSDKLQYYFPVKQLVVEAWRGGVPLWEPRLYSGYPIIGEAEAQVFYPGTLPYFFLSAPDASDLVMLVHLIAAGLGMLAYLRALRLHHLAALLGAITFMLNTVVAGWLIWDTAIGVMVWLPWIWWAFETALQPGRFGVAALGAVALGLTYLGGQLQWTLYALLALALYCAFRFIFPQHVSRLRIGLLAVVIGLLGTTLVAIQLFPTVEFFATGHRGQMTFEALTRGLDWSGFLTLWTPRFYGDVLRNYWGALNYTEFVVYAGVAPLLLALIAIARRVDVKVGFFAGLGVFAAACVAGTDVYRMLSWLPGFEGLTPSRMRYLVVVSVTVLAAFGLDSVLRRQAGRRWRSAGTVLGAAAVLGLGYAVARTSHLPAEPDQLTFLSLQEILLAMLMILSVGLLALGSAAPRWRSAAPLSVVVLTVADLWLAGANYQRAISIAYFYPPTPGLSVVQSDRSLFRILTTRREHFDWTLKPNLPVMYGLNDVAGFASVYMRRYAEFLHQIDANGPQFTVELDLGVTQFGSPLVDLLNVKYAISGDELSVPGWQRIFDGELRRYQRTAPLPRAWIASTAQVVSDDATILTRLAQHNFDPRQTVIVDQQPLEPAGTAGRDPAGEVSLDRYENNHLTLTATMQRDGWLVLSEIFYPGWTATIDGIPANLYRADYVLRTIPVPAGQHRIELSFMPGSFVIGAIVSAISVVVLLVVVIAARRYDRPAQPGGA